MIVIAAVAVIEGPRAQRYTSACGSRVDADRDRVVAVHEREQRLQADPCRTSAYAPGAGADDGAAHPGLRKHADSEHAATAIPAIAFPDQLPCAALSQWRPGDHARRRSRTGASPRSES